MSGIASGSEHDIGLLPWQVEKECKLRPPGNPLRQCALNGVQLEKGVTKQRDAEQDTNRWTNQK